MRTTKDIVSKFAEPPVLKVVLTQHSAGCIHLAQYPEDWEARVFLIVEYRDPTRT